MIDRLGRKVQTTRELRIGVTTYQQAQHIDFAHRESRRIAACRSARSTRNPAHTPVAQTLAHHRGEGARTQLFEDGERLA